MDGGYKYKEISSLIKKWYIPSSRIYNLVIIIKIFI
jgi:hypothetical protein